MLSQNAAENSKRSFDSNGWFEVKHNPLSKVGIFAYSGRAIGAPEPDRIYMVLRSPEELADPACIESFKLLPWVNEHKMLGSTDKGLTPAEAHGVQGVIGQDIYFQDGILYGNIKLFSESQAQLLALGKEELSAGYRCKYDFTPGVWNGQQYDAVQRRIRGNHVASVDQGRMGPEVAVLDHLKFTFDAKEFFDMADNEKKNEGEGTEKKGMTLEEAVAMLETIVPQIAAINEKLSGLTPKTETETAAMDEDKADKKDDKKDDEKSGMDAAEVKRIGAELADLKKNGIKALLGEVSKRDKLAEDLSHHVGTFDHKEKTLDEVAAYGVEKLGLQVAKGGEFAALQGFLHNRAKPTGVPGVTNGMDSAESKNSGVGKAIDEAMAGGTKK